MSGPVSVVVPARNEAETIGKVVKTLSGMEDVAEVIVVDNGSTDETGPRATAAGARCVFEARPGMGNAVKAGFAAARHNWVMKIDADLEKFDLGLFARMGRARAPGVGLIKGAWNDPRDNMPMTRLLVKPGIAVLAPELMRLRAPNTGIYLFDCSLIAHQELTGDYSVDLDVMFRVHASGAEVAEVDIGRIVHDMRDVGHYNHMAEMIMAYFMQARDDRLTDETIIMAQRAEQVAVHALGLAAARGRAGAGVTICLQDAEDEAADILRGALWNFPTVRVTGLEAANGFAPRRSSQKLTMLAPFPVANDDDAIRAALQLRAGIGAGLPTDLLLMPLGPGHHGAVDSFRANMALDVSAGAAIKAQALRDMQLSDTGPNARELFQTYDALPETLQIDLRSGGEHPAAGNQ